MKFHLTRTIEDRSPADVMQALANCLKQEAWEIHRYATSVVALGIGPSRGVVNLADTATFEIDPGPETTTLQVEIEYQHAWFIAEAIQSETVHARFNAIFASLRANLELPPESPLTSVAQKYAAPPQQPDTSRAIAEPLPPVGLAEPQLNAPSTSQTVNVEEPPAPLVAPTIPPQLPDLSFVPPNRAHRRAPGWMYVTSSAVLVLMGCLAYTTYSKAHPHNRISPPPSAKGDGGAPLPSLRPDIHPTHFPSALPTTQPPTSSGPAIPNPTSTLSPNSMAHSHAEDLKDWLDEWATSQRTRDAKTQASFYADEVEPYRTSPQASRDVVYQDKQNSIRNRKGLWTFNIEDVAVRKKSAATASVSLKKHIMMQSGSIEVSEQRVASILTLKRTQSGWQITGERDLP